LITEKDSEIILNNTNEFKKALGVSFIAHFALLCAFLIQFFVFKSSYIDLTQAINVNIGNVVESDRLPPKVVTPAEEAAELPQKTEKEFEKITKDKPIQNLPKPEEIDLKKSKKNQKNALKELKKISAIEKIKNDLKKNALKQNLVALARSNKHIIAAGAPLTGLAKLEANSYLVAIDKSIKLNWTLPQWLINKPLKARVHIRISPTGALLEKQIVDSSGNSGYDSQCLEAIDKALPFPKVPEKLIEKFRTEGVIVGFPE
jgi:TonB family protein